MSITGSNNPFACEPVVFANANSIISLGTITRDGNQFTFSVGFVWKINGVIYQNTAPVVLTIAEASEGFQRIDNALLNASNTIELQQGLESASIALKPVAPDTNIVLTSWNISGTTIGDTEDPIIGTSFVKKSFFAPFVSTVTGADAIIPLDPNGYSEIRLTDASLTSIAGFDLSLITGVPTAEVPYNGKPYIIRNLTGNNITIKNELGAADFPFYLSGGADLLFPNGQAIYLLYDASGFNEIFKSWVDLSTKLDKSSTPSSVYTTDAQGLQVMKPISEFQPVGDYVTVNTTQTVTGNKTFNDVGLIKKNNTAIFPSQSGGSFYIGDDDDYDDYDRFEFYSFDGTDGNNFGFTLILSNPEDGNYIRHTSNDGQVGSVLSINQYKTYLSNKYGGQNTSIYVDGQNSKIKIEGTQNKYASLGTSLITGNKNFEFPDQSGTLALLSDLTDTQTALNLKLPIESPSTTGTVISFTTDKVYGTLTTPETGNITADVTNAKLGVTNIIIHNSGTAPTFDSKFKKLSGSGNYVTGVVNYIYCTYISTTEIIYSINQRA